MFAFSAANISQRAEYDKIMTGECGAGKFQAWNATANAYGPAATFYNLAFGATSNSVNPCTGQPVKSNGEAVTMSAQASYASCAETGKTKYPTSFYWGSQKENWRNKGEVCASITLCAVNYCFPVNIKTNECVNAKGVVEGSSITCDDTDCTSCKGSALDSAFTTTETNFNKIVAGQCGTTSVSKPTPDPDAGVIAMNYPAFLKNRKFSDLPKCDDGSTTARPSFPTDCNIASACADGVGSDSSTTTYWCAKSGPVAKSCATMGSSCSYNDCMPDQTMYTSTKCLTSADIQQSLSKCKGTGLNAAGKVELTSTLVAGLVGAATLVLALRNNRRN